MGEKYSDKFWPRIRLPPNSRDLLHAANLRHGTDGFTSPPKEGVLRIFSPLKIRRLRSGLNAQTWVPKASTLPLDYRSRVGLNTVTYKIWGEIWKFIHSIQEEKSNKMQQCIKILLFHIYIKPNMFRKTHRPLSGA